VSAVCVVESHDLAGILKLKQRRRERRDSGIKLAQSHEILPIHHKNMVVILGNTCFRDWPITLILSTLQEEQ